MSANHLALLRNLRSDFQTASEKHSPFFHAILKFPPNPWRGTWERYNEAIGALGADLLTPITFGALPSEPERLLVGCAKSGETEWTFSFASVLASVAVRNLTTRAFQCLPAGSTIQEPFHSFKREPGFNADYSTRWMLFVYRRLADSGSLVVTRPATELEFDRMAPSFSVKELDSRVMVAYLSVDALLASVYAIDVELTAAFTTANETRAQSGSRRGRRAPNDELLDFDQALKKKKPHLSDKEILVAFRKKHANHPIFESDDPRASLRAARSRRKKKLR